MIPLLTRDQHVLLEATLAKGHTALSAACDWFATTDFDHLGSSNYALLPALYRNLERQADNPPWMGRLKGIYRKTWTQNHLLLRRVRPRLEVMMQSKMPFVLAGTAAYVLHYTPDMGLYPLDEFSVFVAPDVRERMTSRCAVEDDGLRFLADEAIDRHTETIPAAVGGYPVLNPTDQLWRTCRPPHPAPLLQARQAITLLKEAGDAIDWSKLCHLAKIDRQSWFLGMTLNHLQDRYNVVIPKPELASLLQAASWPERIEYRLNSSPSRHWAVRLPRAYLRYRRTYRGRYPVGPFLLHRYRIWQQAGNG